MATVTIRDVAREAGVSTATVSYVLNNSGRVSEQTRQRVLEAARRLGYRANITARNLQARETRLLGYTWRPTPPDQFNPVLDQFLNAIAQAAAHHDYRVLTFPSETIEEELATYEDMVLSSRVDGFILSNTNLDDPRVRKLSQKGFPFVAFGRANPEWDFPWVDIDGRWGVRKAVEHLIERGHERIACLAWPEDSLTGAYRLQGYVEAMKLAGLPVDAAWIARTENKHDDAYETTRRLLELPAARRPTAIMASSDLMAMGAMNAAHDMGVEVGRELALVGFDDAPVARYLRPPLSSLRQPIAEVGERLIVMLVDLCQGRPVSQQHVLLKPQLIIRASSDFRF
ncbi:MAG: LacI family transcriptional regulator [Chloroflexi bacterium]|nr:LacI family transcriptional regulator [Chloroflexota bacterium]